MVWPSGEDIAKGGGVLLVDGAVVDVVWFRFVVHFGVNNQHGGVNKHSIH